MLELPYWKTQRVIKLDCDNCSYDFCVWWCMEAHGKVELKRHFRTAHEMIRDLVKDLMVCGSAQGPGILLVSRLALHLVQLLDVRTRSIPGLTLATFILLFIF